MPASISPLKVLAKMYGSSMPSLQPAAPEASSPAPAAVMDEAFLQAMGSPLAGRRRRKLSQLMAPDGLQRDAAPQPPTNPTPPSSSFLGG